MDAELTLLRREALQLLSRREYSQRELYQKLSRKTKVAANIEVILSELSTQGWQSDQRFTENFVRFRAGQGFGPLYILMNLRDKGIDEAIASTIVYSDDYDWISLARICLEKKYRGQKVDIIKQKRYLLSRGFTYNIIHEAMHEHAS